MAAMAPRPSIVITMWFPRVLIFPDWLIFLQWLYLPFCFHFVFLHCFQSQMYYSLLSNNTQSWWNWGYISLVPGFLSLSTLFSTDCVEFLVNFSCNRERFSYLHPLLAARSLYLSQDGTFTAKAPSAKSIPTSPHHRLAESLIYRAL